MAPSRQLYQPYHLCDLIAGSPQSLIDSLVDRDLDLIIHLSALRRLGEFQVMWWWEAAMTWWWSRDVLTRRVAFHRAQ
jgi:hypothetical protein